MNFKNKVVLVTGASSGIGAAMAVKFTEEGAKLAMVGRNQNKLKKVAEKCGKAGATPLVLIADLAKDEDVKRIVNETLKHYQQLDVLINNAGIGNSASILADNAMQVFDQLMATNLRSVVYLTHLASKHLIETKGNIINISSIAATNVIMNESFSYSASKAALSHFTRAIASELAEKGVRVNVINPGPVKSDFMENTGGPVPDHAAALEFIKTFTALQRISESEEIADLAIFLASDKAVGITGSTFVSDNGVLVKAAF